MMLPSMPAPRGPAPAPVPPPAARSRRHGAIAAGMAVACRDAGDCRARRGPVFRAPPVRPRWSRRPKRKRRLPNSPRRLSSPAGDMVLVPAGDFLFGENKERVTLPAFYVDKTEVTNGAYDRFCKETGHQPPAGFDPAQPDYPVVNVSIADAKAFAQWAGKRLPSSAGMGKGGARHRWTAVPVGQRARPFEGQCRHRQGAAGGGNAARAPARAGRCRWPATSLN